jgi:hypothetical protein
MTKILYTSSSKLSHVKFSLKNNPQKLLSQWEILPIENPSPEDLLPPLENVGILFNNKYYM